MPNSIYDIIVIGAGSGGLSVSLFMNKVGLKTLLIDKSDKRIGGDCLNFGCVPSKALIHVSRVIHETNEALKFGVNQNNKPNIAKATEYVLSRQSIIRKHENAEYLRSEGLDVALGIASFISKDEVKVNDIVYKGKKIVIAAGSYPTKLKVPGVEKVKYYDNESIFDIRQLPAKILMVGGGPIGVEIGQALRRLGSNITILQKGDAILPKEDKEISNVLMEKLKEENIEFIMNASVKSFADANTVIVENKRGEKIQLKFDAVFVGIGRSFDLESLQLDKAGIVVKDGIIQSNAYLQTSNKNVYVCGDIAGSLKFSHAAEQHERLLLNNFFSPLKKKLKIDHMSWVTFTDPEVATFGLQEKQLKERNIDFEKLNLNFDGDDRAIIDDYRYGKLILFISKKGFLRKQKILGGTMIAPHAGELIEELILANEAGLSINHFFNKIYPYPVASRVNQQIIVHHRQKSLDDNLKKLLRRAYKILG